mmetsp:Transcript_19373/g.59825  ORF Transcript_19373/g.59825 Transcript_19373/m.59825 type:complete len:207 (-) Transcript_19373:702-1322(-)
MVSRKSSLLTTRWSSPASKSWTASGASPAPSTPTSLGSSVSKGAVAAASPKPLSEQTQAALAFFLFVRSFHALRNLRDAPGLPLKPGDRLGALASPFLALVFLPPLLHSAATVLGSRKWGLLTYLASNADARTLLDFVRADIRGEPCATSCTSAKSNVHYFVDNAGQLDRRTPPPFDGSSPPPPPPPQCTLLHRRTREEGDGVGTI